MIRELESRAIEVSARPLLCLPLASAQCVAAYIEGLDHASSGALLCGFREWLLVRSGKWSTMPWWSLVAQSAGHEMAPDITMNDADSGCVVSSIHVSLGSFFEFRDRFGLHTVFTGYYQWIKSQRGSDTSHIREMSLEGLRVIRRRA